MAAIDNVDVGNRVDTVAAEYRDSNFYKGGQVKQYDDYNKLLGLSESRFYEDNGGRPPTRNGEKIKPEDSLRTKTVREAGFAAGVRAGLLWRTDVTNRALNLTARNLDTIYNFASLMIDSRVIPPVLTEVRDVQNAEDDRVVKTNKTVYKIQHDARFSSRAPHWRTYLYRVYDKNSILPDAMLLPRNELEQSAWDAGVVDGWPRGIEQARDIFQQDVAMLNRDYSGMVLYHRLNDQNMISIPVVAESKLPLNATGDTLEVDGTTLKLVAIPQFVNNLEAWRPLVLEKTVNEQPAGGRVAGLPVIHFDTRDPQLQNALSPEAKEALRRATKVMAIESKPAPVPSVVLSTNDEIKNVDVGAADNSVQVTPVREPVASLDEADRQPKSTEEQAQVLKPVKSDKPADPNAQSAADQLPKKYAENPALDQYIRSKVEADMKNQLALQAEYLAARAITGGAVPIVITAPAATTPSGQ